jgi:hypothetical protein
MPVIRSSACRHDAAGCEPCCRNSPAARERSFLATLGHMRDMTKDAEHEMHAILLSCKRARKQMLGAFPEQKSRLH